MPTLGSPPLRAYIQNRDRQYGLSALPRGERKHSGKAREQIHRPAMRANFAGHIKREFHLIKRVLQVSSADSANDGIAFVANNVGPMSKLIPTIKDLGSATCTSQ